MNICFLARPLFDKFSVAIYKYIRENLDREAGGYFITTDKWETRYVREQIPDAHIFETSKYLREHWPEFTGEKLVELEKKYDCAPIWKYIYTDRFLINRDYDYVVHVAAGLFSFFEDLFSRNPIDFYYSEAVATLQGYAAYIVGKKLGAKYITQMAARSEWDETYLFCMTDELQHIANFNSDYRSVQYSETEYRRAEALLSDFESRDVRPASEEGVKERTCPKLRLGYLKLPLLALANKFRRRYNDPYSYMYYKSYRATSAIQAYFRYQRARKYYHPADYSRKFVYFPLHYQPEASTLVCAPKYEKQAFFIDSWAKSLPADTMLYVKEHYAGLGSRDLQFYRDLQKYPNVALIDPWESSRKLIEGSIAVTTLTGTPGWEAMLLRKPVFLGGRIFFDNAPGVIQVPDVFDCYLEELARWRRPTREDVIQYLCEYIRTLEPGNVNIDSPAALEPNNIKKVSESLYRQMQIMTQ